MAALGGRAVSYERGTPVGPTRGLSIWFYGGPRRRGGLSDSKMALEASASSLLSSLELSYTKVYEPLIRARLGTAAHFCEVVVLKLRTVPGR